MIITIVKGVSISSFDYLSYEKIEDLIISLKKEGARSIGLEYLSPYDSKFTYKRVAIDDLNEHHLNWVHSDVDHGSRYLRIWKNNI